MAEPFIDPQTAFDYIWSHTARCREEDCEVCAALKVARKAVEEVLRPKPTPEIDALAREILGLEGWSFITTSNRQFFLGQQEVQQNLERVNKLIEDYRISLIRGLIDFDQMTGLVRAEMLLDNTKDPQDIGYNMALEDVLKIIERLKERASCLTASKTDSTVSSEKD